MENEMNENNQNINDCFYMIKEKDENLGIIGFMEIDKKKGIIIGPVMKEKNYTYENILESINLLRNMYKYQDKLISFDVIKENTRLCKVLEENGFTLSSSHITMKIKLYKNKPYSMKPDRIIYSATRDDKDILIQINKLFKEVLEDWVEEDIDSLYEYLEQGYEMSYSLRDGNITGAILWIWFENLGYGRIEYIAVTKSDQRKGYGSELLDYTLSKLSKVLKRENLNYFYLDLDTQNEKAYNLYRKKGFEYEYEDIVYRSY
ncbi:GNAT family N-acetyltransferase [Anaerocolumna sp. AGMB13020]|uniref:GNAT family N-acetyltransferase n=1 Tax=Anaerocolumna sp. AGMB13020 TaxID=3081750 RepID=UPI0029558F66|nr:GNAT family N-acetyltransferase [Anaerocolumna sp. AGMB13020]WOO37256.1 GNAT family N-acetyltransferase [Anaerocolumna sp. AGMB13020]